MINFCEGGLPVFRGSSALERGDLKSKGKGKLSFHFCGDDETAEVVLRTFISVNQLRIHGVAADMCDELACRISGASESTGKLVAQNNSETMVMPTELSTTNNTLRTNDKVQGNFLHDYEHKFANLPDHVQLIKLCSNVGTTKTVAKGQCLVGLDDAELDKLGRRREERGGREEYIVPRDDKLSKVKRMDPWEHEDRSSFGGGSQSPSRPSRNRDHDTILIRRWNLFLGHGREWNQQIRDGNDGGNPREPH